MSQNLTAEAGTVTMDRLQEIGRAFACRDVDAVVDAFADDGEFRNAKGPDVWGRTYKGKAEIRAFFTGLFAGSPDIQWRHLAELVCDPYTFRGDLIARKDTCIKAVGSPLAAAEARPKISLFHPWRTT